MYLDNAATTRVDYEILTKTLPCFLEDYGNPSSKHRMGCKAKELIKEARAKVAMSINADPEQIFFFSSATEANNYVLNLYPRIACSPWEHSSVEKKFVTGYSHIDLFSHMLVNNETGDLFDIKTLCESYHKDGTLFHTDATQAFGKVPIDVKDLDVDFLTFSGHKIHSLKGCGVLYVKDPSALPEKNTCLIGGEQEKGIHPGTENVPAIVAMGYACEKYNYDEEKDYLMHSLYDKIILKLRDSGLDYRINRIELLHVPNIINISFKDIDGETLQNMLSQQLIYVSTSSACTSGIKKSRILSAMGVPDDYIYGSIRLSFSYADIDDPKYELRILNNIDRIIETVNKALQIAGLLKGAE